MRIPYDSAAKHLLMELGESLLKYLLETPDIQVLSRLDTEQQRMWVRRGDSTMRMLINGEEAIAHTEVQLHDSREEMQFRMAGYCGYLVSMHKLPVYCTVIYLHPRAGRRDPGGYTCQFGDAHHFSMRYKVLRLREVEGESVLAAQEPALLPLTPLMKPPAGMDAEAWLQACVRATAEAPVPVALVADLMALLGVFGNAGYSSEQLNRFIGRDIVEHSTYLQSLFAEREAALLAEMNQRAAEANQRAEQAREQAEQAREQAEQAHEQAEQAREQAREQAEQAHEQAEQAREQAREQAEQAHEQAEQAHEQGQRHGIIEGLMALLASRFDPTVVQALRPTFENVKELERLKQLLSAAGQAPNLEAFLQQFAE